MSNQYPDFDSINLVDYELVDGYYTLGFLKKHRPDCFFITSNEWNSQKDHRLLDQLIQHGLSKGLIVCVVQWDEDIINPGHLKLTEVLNKYKDEPVWLVTQLNKYDQKIYTYQHQLQCKIVEIPWYFLNECLTYYAVADRSISQEPTSNKFLTMLGRYDSRYDRHKVDLAYALRPYEKFGTITISRNGKYPADLLEFCQLNPVPPYTNIRTRWKPMAAQVKIGKTWISSNVENFLHIQKTYADIPLMIHPETTTGIFQITEKSLWPLLLGKLMLVYGKQGLMEDIQRFYDVEFSLYADLSFDQYNNKWSNEGHQERLQLLIERNQDLIRDCRDVYKKLQPKLELARWTLGRNIYQYFIQQLEQIKM